MLSGKGLKYDGKEKRDLEQDLAELAGVSEEAKDFIEMCLFGEKKTANQILNSTKWFDDIKARYADSNDSLELTILTNLISHSKLWYL